MHKTLQEFLDNSKFMTVSLRDNEYGVWSFNAYYGNTDKAIYFVSTKDTRHALLINEDGRAAFSLGWANPKDIEDRVGVQGAGICRMVTNPKDLLVGFKSLFKKFPDWKEWINEKNVFTNVYNTRLFKISIKYIKYWNDKEFGEEGTKEFKF